MCLCSAASKEEGGGKHCHGRTSSFRHTLCWKGRYGFVSSGADAGVLSLWPLRDNSCVFLTNKPDYMQWNSCHLSSLPPHRGSSLAVPPTPTSHSWGKVHHHIHGHLMVIQKPGFWEQSLENIVALPVHLKVKYVYLTEHWDGICRFSWPKEAHRLFAGVPWKRRWEWKQHYWTLHLNVYSDLTTLM